MPGAPDRSTPEPGSGARRARNCIVVGGPTASGKTRLGVELARRLGGEVVSADSRQVYRGMDVGTGKDLDAYESGEGRIPHHLIDVVDPEEIYSLFHYQRDAFRVLSDLLARGRLPIVVGGTGLYIEAVLRGWSVPDVPADEDYRSRMMERDLDVLVHELERRSPEIHARTVLDCRRRVVRALEVARWTERHGELAVNRTDLDLRPATLVVTWPRPELRARIEERLLARLDAGLIEEVERLRRRGIPPERWRLFGMEYRHVGRYLDGEVSRDGMVQALLADIRYLARRQETYFRGIARRGLETHAVERAELDRAMEILEPLPIDASP